MSELEPPFGLLDSGGMAGLIEAIPEQIEQALARLESSPWTITGEKPKLVAVGAMGGSAMSAGFVESLYRDRMPGPFLIVRDYAWPACVGAGALAVLSSYSGNTEETLALYDAAVAGGVARAVMTTGGTLGARAEADGVAVSLMPGGSPPRAAMYGSLVTLTALLHAIGWIDDAAPSWRAAARRLRAMNAHLAPSVPEPRNPAKRLARDIAARNVFVYAAEGVAAPVATRVRHQLNENAKVFGHSALVPELNHNEIVSWEHPNAMLRDALVLVLHDADDRPRLKLRLELTGEYAKSQGADVFDLRVSEGDPLGRAMELSQFGDYVSLYLAFLRGVDPTPIASIDAFKSKLAERGDEVTR